MTSKTIYMRSNIRDSIARTYSIRFLGNIESTTINRNILYSHQDKNLR